MKSPSDRSLTLMHYLATTVREKFPHLMSFVSELHYLEKASTGGYVRGGRKGGEGREEGTEKEREGRGGKGRVISLHGLYCQIFVTHFSYSSLLPFPLLSSLSLSPFFPSVLSLPPSLLSLRPLSPSHPLSPHSLSPYPQYHLTCWL